MHARTNIATVRFCMSLRHEDRGMHMVCLICVTVSSYFKHVAI